MYLFLIFEDFEVLNRKHWSLTLNGEVWGYHLCWWWLWGYHNCQSKSWAIELPGGKSGYCFLYFQAKAYYSEHDKEECMVVVLGVPCYTLCQRVLGPKEDWDGKTGEKWVGCAKMDNVVSNLTTALTWALFVQSSNYGLWNCLFCNVVLVDRPYGEGTIPAI